jgi:hypothetical protein
VACSATVFIAGFVEIDELAPNFRRGIHRECGYLMSMLSVFGIGKQDTNES